MVVGQLCPAINGLTFVKGEPIAIGQQEQDKLKKHLTHLQHQYKDRHVYVVGVTQEDDMQKVQRFVAGQGSSMDYTVAVDAQGAVQGLMERAGARGIPHAFIVDANNTIAYSGHPRDAAFEDALRKAAAAAAPKRAPEPLPLITESHEELMARSIKELKAILTERGISMVGLAEKSDLVAKVEETCRSVTYYRA